MGNFVKFGKDTTLHQAHLAHPHLKQAPAVLIFHTYPKEDTGFLSAIGRMPTINKLLRLHGFAPGNF